MRKKKNTETAVQKDTNKELKPLLGSAIPVHSLFENVFCTYSSDYDDSYIRWLLEEDMEVAIPVLTLESKIARPSLHLKPIDELLANASIPDDYVTGTQANKETEEEEITIL